MHRRCNMLVENINNKYLHAVRYATPTGASPVRLSGGDDLFL